MGDGERSLPFKSKDKKADTSEIEKLFEQSKLDSVLNDYLKLNWIRIYAICWPFNWSDSKASSYYCETGSGKTTQLPQIAMLAA